METEKQLREELKSNKMKTDSEMERLEYDMCSNQNMTSLFIGKID
jgi:hypothetical protein